MRSSVTTGCASAPIENGCSSSPSAGVRTAPPPHGTCGEAWISRCPTVTLQPRKSGSSRAEWPRLLGEHRIRFRKAELAERIVECAGIVRGQHGALAECVETPADFAQLRIKPAG